MTSSRRSYSPFCEETTWNYFYCSDIELSTWLVEGAHRMFAALTELWKGLNTLRVDLVLPLVG